MSIPMKDDPAHNWQAANGGKRDTSKVPGVFKDTMTDDYGNECAVVRVLPIGGGGNILTGRAGYEREMAFRRERIRAGVAFDLPSWESLAVYFPKEGAK